MATTDFAFTRGVALQLGVEEFRRETRNAQDSLLRLAEKGPERQRFEVALRVFNAGRKERG